MLISRKDRKSCTCDTIFKRSSIAGEEKSLLLNLDRPYRLKYSQVGHGIFVINVRLNEKEQFFSRELFYFPVVEFLSRRRLFHESWRSVRHFNPKIRTSHKYSCLTSHQHISTSRQFILDYYSLCPVIDRALRDRTLNVDLKRRILK